MVIDSNILIYALNPSSPKHASARQFLSQEKKLFLTQQNIFETIRIITHKKFPKPLSSNQAVKVIGVLLNTISRILPPTIQTPAITLELIKKYQISGTEVFDAYMVATLLSHGVKSIASDNVKHLGKYKEISVINPFEAKV